jgi:hypothetical protein
MGSQMKQDIPSYSIDQVVFLSAAFLEIIRFRVNHLSLFSFRLLNIQLVKPSNTTILLLIEAMVAKFPQNAPTTNVFI